MYCGLTTCFGKPFPVEGRLSKNSILAAWTLTRSAGFIVLETSDCQGRLPRLQWTRLRARFSRSLLRAVQPRWASLKIVL